MTKTNMERNLVPWLAGLLLALALAGCTAARPGASLPTAVPAAAEPQGEGGEEATAVFVDPSGRFSFEHPQSWGVSTQPREDVRFTGRDEFISVTIVNTALSAMDFANSDESTLATTSADSRGRLLRTYQQKGTPGAMREYGWQAGPSPVTGKMVPSMARRYYLPGANGALAIFTYSSPVRTYDPEGADDFATASSGCPEPYPRRAMTTIQHHISPTWSAGAQPTPFALELRDVFKIYREGSVETVALRGAALTVRPGEVVAIVGPSGSGCFLKADPWAAPFMLASHWRR